MIVQGKFALAILPIMICLYLVNFSCSNDEKKSATELSDASQSDAFLSQSALSVTENDQLFSISKWDTTAVKGIIVQIYQGCDTLNIDDDKNWMDQMKKEPYPLCESFKNVQSPVENLIFDSLSETELRVFVAFSLQDETGKNYSEQVIILYFSLIDDNIYFIDYDLAG